MKLGLIFILTIQVSFGAGETSQEKVRPQDPKTCRYILEPEDKDASNLEEIFADTKKFAQSDYHKVCQGYQAAYQMVKNFDKSGDHITPAGRCRWTEFSVDYKHCVASLNTQMATSLSELALSQQQTIQRGMVQAEANTALMQSEAVGGDGQQTILNAASGVVGAEKQIQIVNASFQSAKAAALTALVSSWPGENRIDEKCQKALGENQNCPFIAQAAKYNPNIFPNKAMKGFLMMEIAKSASGAASAAFLAKNLGDNQENLEKASEYITDTSVVTAEFCAINPEHPDCADGNNIVRPGFNFQDNLNLGSTTPSDLNFGGGGENTNYQAQAPESLPAGLSEELIDNFGGSPTYDGDEGGISPAAKLGAGNSSGGGGGGGVGGAGGASLGPNPGGDGGGEKKDTPITEGVSKKKKGGTTGWTNARGSGGAKKPGATGDEENPFAALFDQGKQTDDSRAPASELEFEGVLGLFEKISRRYSKVQDAHRLLEYTP